MVQSAELAPSEPSIARRGPGRPRHADTEPRAYRAALELFGRRGWAGLTLDGVASHAGIGKSSIYLRWRGKRELLLEAVRHLRSQMDVPDTDSLDIRDCLVAHATARARLLRGEYGPAVVSLFAAVASDPEAFAELSDEDVVRGLRALAPRVEQAIADGELRTGTPVSALLDAIEGAVLVQAVLAPVGEAGQLEEYVAGLVDLELDGAAA
ncbi:TetR/AcrR family transcriptional regulator [Georgenia deserti]|uniref:TetR/AcrR family transcriptional regulator n=1 Tax=Georgenia deserti TaxID=2093781 RepID=A0ABW4L5Z3_9MICO